MAKLGSKDRPVVVRVKTQERAEGVLARCNALGLQCIVGIEPDKPEDITDIERALNPIEPERSYKVGRNEPCPCGSGKKYKKCCGAADRAQGGGGAC